MKFLKYENKFTNAKEYLSYLEEKLEYNYFYFDYVKEHKKYRKVLSNTKSGVTNNIKKNSIKRDKNNSLIQQFMNLSQKNGKKTFINKNLNLMIENIFLSLGQEFDDFKNYEEYYNFIYLHNSDVDYSDINKIIQNCFINLESIFEIKTKKNNKKLKLPNKYSHEIVYIPKQKRFKYVLRSLNVYTESFKNYNIWERFFWSFFITILNKNSSLLKKRRDYINLKSIKFFKKPIKK